MKLYLIPKIKSKTENNANNSSKTRIIEKFKENVSLIKDKNKMGNMKVAVIQPEVGFKPFSALGTYPLGILYLATTLKEARPNYDVKCFDEDSKPVLKNEYIHPFLLEADIVGISGLTSTIPRTYLIANKLRELRARRRTNPSLKVMIGGMHATAMPDEAIQHADIVVKGECEGNIVDLIESGKEGVVIGEKIDDLDSLVNPDYSLLEYKKRRITDILYGDLASINSSRGCPFGCDFCSVTEMFGKNLRIESPEKQYQKIKSLREQGFRRFFDHSDNFSLNKRNRKDFFNILINRNLDISYIVQDRIDLLQEEDYVEKMARSGCSMVMFGMEVADEKFLKAHKKELDLRKVEKGVRLLRKNKIVPYAFCMIDPENPETTETTIRFLRELNIKYAQFTIPTPLPGTALYQELKDKISAGWEYFNGLTLVTESGEKMRAAAKQLSEAWKKFYSPTRVSLDIFKGEITKAGLRLYGWNIGRKILKIQPGLRIS